MSTLYHVTDPDFMCGTMKSKGWPKFPEEYHEVAQVASEEPETVWRLTNSVEYPWWDNGEVTPKFPVTGEKAGCRSTSVGDVIKLESGKLFVCDLVGWTEMQSSKGDTT
jgi:hypothetical protein